jgi:hypothetical protein
MVEQTIDDEESLRQVRSAGERILERLLAQT